MLYIESNLQFLQHVEPKSPTQSAIGSERSDGVTSVASPKLSINSLGMQRPPPQITIFGSQEMQTMNHFVLIRQVLNELIEDLSRLNLLGSRRSIILMKVSGDLPRAADSAASLHEEEHSRIVDKIRQNLMFCVVRGNQIEQMNCALSSRRSDL